MDFEYRLTGAGWAEGRISDGTNEAKMRVSYLSDALGELLMAVRLLLEGADGVRCSWEDEPGEYRWIFTRTGDDHLRLKILAFDDMWDWPDEEGAKATMRPDERGELFFSTTQAVGVLERAIADGAAAVLREHGEDGYLAKWGMHSFPSGTLAFIRQRLDG